MEIKALRYFLAAAREENISRAAEALHVSQPTMSKQIKALEDELGQKLFERHSFNVKLTDEGILLRKRASDLVDMADKTLLEFQNIDNVTGGDVYFGLAESYQLRHLARVIKRFLDEYPDFHYHTISGDRALVTEKLDKGILDFAVIVETPDESKYDYITMPETDKWGLVFKKDDPLAKKKKITFSDIENLPLYISESAIDSDLTRWCGEDASKLHFQGYFSLSYNGSVFAKEGLGYLLTYDHLIDTSEKSGLVFRQLSPVLENPLYLIWRKYQVFTPIAEKFLTAMRDYCEVK